VLLAPSMLILAALVAWLRLRGAPKSKPPWFAPSQFWVTISVYVGVTILVILTAYRFEVSSLAQDEQLQEARWIGPVYKTIQQIAPQIGQTPEKIVQARVPAYDYIKGLVLQSYHTLAQNTWLGGETYQYALGMYSKNGWWWYFPLTFAIKTPLTLIIVLIVVSVLGVRAVRRPLEARWPVPSRWVPSEVRRHEEFLFLIVPMVVFMSAYMTSTINIGHRYLLPLYPFLYVLASRLAAPWPKVKNPRLPVIASGLSVLAMLPGSLLIHPHYISYFNELVGPSNGYKYLADSNVDWGQDLLQLKHYLDKVKPAVVYIDISGTVRPEDLGIQYLPLPKVRAPNERNFLVAISVNEYLIKTTRYPQGMYPWLHNETPVHRVGYSIFIYDLAAFY